MRRRLPPILREERPFALLWTSQSLSMVGDRVTPIALAFAVLELGGATDLGIVMAAQSLPFAVFSIAGGVIADRVGRREVMLVSDIVRALVQALLAVLLLTGAAEIWMMVVLSAIYGAASAVFMPAMTALVPELVGPARLQPANAALSLTRSSTVIIGPVIAGVLVALSGPGEAIALDAATFVGSAFLLLRLRVPVAADHGEGERAGFLAELREGWAEVRARSWLVRGLVAMSAYHVFVLPAIYVLGPVLAERELDGAGSWAAIVAAFGVGSIAGDVLALKIRIRRPLLISAGALVFASCQAAIIGSGMGTVGIAAFEALAGIGVSWFFTFWDLSVQEQIPPGAVARVSAYDYAVSVGLMPIGLALAGPISDAAGLQPTLIGMSVIGVTSALLLLATPAVRRVQRPAEALAGSG
jgi:predicted MFS family arabinose efflux permease